jgi:hypothetical protein
MGNPITVDARIGARTELVTSNNGVLQGIVENPFTFFPVTEVETVLGATDSLRALDPGPNVLAAIVDGCVTAGDGGGGTWYWDSSSSAADNIGLVVKPTAHVGNGRWIRIFDGGAVNVMWFGAIGDGVTDDLAAIVAAIAAVPTTGGGLYFPGRGRIYLMSDVATINGYSKLVIYSDSGAVIKQTKDKRAFNFYNLSTVEMYGMWFEGTIQVDGGDPLGGNINQTAIVISAVTDCDIHDCTFSNLGGYGVFPNSYITRCNIHHNNFIETMAGCQAGSGFVNSLNVSDNFFLGFIPTGGAGTLGSDDQLAIFGNTLGGTVSGQVVFSRNIIDKQGPTGANQARCIDIGASPAAQGDLLDIVVSDNIAINCVTTNAVFNGDRPSFDFFGDVLAPLAGVTCTGNVIRNCNMGVDVEGITHEFLFNDNVVEDVIPLPGSVTIPVGIRLYTAAAAKRFQVNDNIFDDIGGTATGTIAAILMQVVTNVRCADNLIEHCGDCGIICITGDRVDIVGNQVHDCASAAFVGATITNFTLSDNTFSTTLTHAINLISMSDGIVHDNRVHNVTGAGILAQGCTEITINDNQVHHCSLYGIAEIVQNNGLAINDNNVHHCTTSGIELQGVNSDLMVQGNRLKNNGAALRNLTTTSRVMLWDNPEVSNTTNNANSRGTVTITDPATTANVAFTSNEPDANYMIVFGTSPAGVAASGRATYAAKAVGGFTINLEAAPGGGLSTVVDWMMVR